MSMKRRSLLLAGMGALALPQPLSAQPYPSRPIRLVVGFAPGGATDIAARLLQPLLSEALGQPVVVENRSGGGGTVATDMLARAEPDGHTLMVASPGQLVVNPLLDPKSSFDAVRDLTPVAQLTTGPLLLVVPANSSFRDARSLVANARARPGAMNYGSAGIGSSMHIAGEMLNALGGLDIVHVPYRGSGPAVNDLVAGKIDFMVDSVSTTMPHVRNGLLRLLAHTGVSPDPQFPGVPPLQEVVPGVVLTTWLALTAPPGLPPAVLARLSEVLRSIVPSAGFADRIRALGSNVHWSSPADLSAFLSEERRRVADVIQRASIQKE
jgi:tripartite-type tricarboxylate transporter receptor subunit TctC